VVQWAKLSLDRIQAKKAVEEENEDPVQASRKWENVEELLHSIGQMRLPDEPELQPGEGMAPGLTLMREFLARMALDAKEEEDRDKEKKEQKDQVTLLTLHGAKGLEYPVVYMVGAEEGYLPHQRTLDEGTDFSEERRLAYVGITRARDHLILTRAKNRIRWGKPVPRYRSRFLDEIPKDLLVLQDQSGTPDLSSQEARDEHETKVKNYLAEIRARLTQKSP
jgi:superfamily I DNA/RNA helicase